MPKRHAAANSVIGSIFAAALLSGVLVWLFRQLSGGVSGRVASVAEPGLVSGLWATIMTRTGIRAFRDKVRGGKDH